MGYLELWLTRIGALLGIFILVAAFFGIWRDRKSPRGRAIGHATSVLRIPVYFLIGFPYFLVSFLLWKPIPLTLVGPLKITVISTGAILYFAGLALYLWAMRTLGVFYNVSSSLGVRRRSDYELIS